MTGELIEQCLELLAFPAVEGAEHPRFPLLKHRHEFGAHATSFAGYQQYLSALVGGVRPALQKSSLFEGNDSAGDIRLQMPGKFDDIRCGNAILESQENQDQDLRTFDSELLFDGPESGFPIEVMDIPHFESRLDLDFIHYVAHLCASIGFVMSWADHLQLILPESQ
jgi:hypothetical protein